MGYWTKPVQPKVFENRTFTWYRAHLIFYLMRLRPKSFNRVQHILKQSLNMQFIELNRPYVSLYVRRSDKVQSREMSRSYALREYFELFTADTLRINLTKIYLNSEDDYVFEEFQQLNHEKKNYYELLKINITRNATFGQFFHWSKTRREQLAIEFLADLFIEVHADLHVGTLTSNWCRLVDAIRLVLGKTIPYYTPENKHLINA